MRADRSAEAAPSAAGKPETKKMAQISLKSVGVSLNAPLFANLTVVVGPGDRLGLVAANGRGKSTLLRCLAGEMEPTSGDITRSRGMRVGYVRQEAPAALLQLTFTEAVAAALDPHQRDDEGWRVDIILDDLAVPENLRTRKVAELSGGWQRMALLARMSRWPSPMRCCLTSRPTISTSPRSRGWKPGWPACRATCRSSSPATTAPSSTP
jgi:ABC-type molybdenum transport system ATPase subunit/photorepair protein PhrA